MLSINTSINKYYLNMATPLRRTPGGARGSPSDRALAKEKARKEAEEMKEMLAVLKAQVDQLVEEKRSREKEEMERDEEVRRLREELRELKESEQELEAESGVESEEEEAEDEEVQIVNRDRGVAEGEARRKKAAEAKREREREEVRERGEQNYYGGLLTNQTDKKIFQLLVSEGATCEQIDKVPAKSIRQVTQVTFTEALDFQDRWREIRGYDLNLDQETLRRETLAIQDAEKAGGEVTLRNNSPPGKPSPIVATGRIDIPVTSPLSDPNQSDLSNFSQLEDNCSPFVSHRLNMSGRQSSLNTSLDTLNRLVPSLELFSRQATPLNALKSVGELEKRLKREVRTIKVSTSTKLEIVYWMFEAAKALGRLHEVHGQLPLSLINYTYLDLLFQDSPIPLSISAVRDPREPMAVPFQIYKLFCGRVTLASAFESLERAEGTTHEWWAQVNQAGTLNNKTLDEKYYKFTQKGGSVVKRVANEIEVLQRLNRGSFEASLEIVNTICDRIEFDREQRRELDSKKGTGKVHWLEEEIGNSQNFAFDAGPTRTAVVHAVDPTPPGRPSSGERGGAKVCYNCQGTGHFAFDCFQPCKRHSQAVRKDCTECKRRREQYRGGGRGNFFGGKPSHFGRGRGGFGGPSQEEMERQLRAQQQELLRLEEEKRARERAPALTHSSPPASEGSGASSNLKKAEKEEKSE